MPPEPKLIAFDTSAAHCAAALLLGDQVITRVDEMAKGQAEHLMPMLEEMLAAAGLGWRDLDAIGVGIGPGNFTGIRISVSAARGLALGLGKPAIGISTLQAQAFGLNGAVLSCLDARRGRAYVQLFSSGEAVSPARLTELMPEAFASDHTPRIVGPIAAEIATLTGCKTASPTCPMIEATARLAATRIGTDHGRPAPLYIRSADAAPPRDPAPVLLS